MSIFSFLFGGLSTGNFAISNKEIAVRGWNASELRQIVGDFQQMYRDRIASNFSTGLQVGDGEVLRVTFPGDITPQLFCWLVNYIQYPKDLDLKSRTILVAGNATISSDFLPSDQSLIGKRIMLYIPTEDTRYDQVFAQVDGLSYEYPFSSERWKRAQAPRLPVGIGDLR